jgi:hypothetical protein
MDCFYGRQLRVLRDRKTSFGGKENVGNTAWNDDHFQIILHQDSFKSGNNIYPDSQSAMGAIKYTPEILKTINETPKNHR